MRKQQPFAVETPHFDQMKDKGYVYSLSCLIPATHVSTIQNIGCPSIMNESKIFFYLWAIFFK